MVDTQLHHRLEIMSKLPIPALPNTDQYAAIADIDSTVAGIASSALGESGKAAAAEYRRKVSNAIQLLNDLGEEAQPEIREYFVAWRSLLVDIGEMLDARPVGEGYER